MRKTRLLILAGLVFVLCGCGGQKQEYGRIYQVSTIKALLNGAYDGSVTLGELKKHGNFGIGTFDKLDGEMIVLNGVVYQVRADGKVYTPPDTMRTPFAVVVRFSNDGACNALLRMSPIKNIPKVAMLKEMETALDSFIGAKSDFYAARIYGKFEYLKVRSVHPQKKVDGKYPKFSTVVENQAVFELKDISGTIVAMRCPSYIGEINVHGWHLHFISDDRSKGGHVLDVRAKDIMVNWNRIPKFDLFLPYQSQLAEEKMPLNSNAAKSGK